MRHIAAKDAKTLMLILRFIEPRMVLKIIVSAFCLIVTAVGICLAGIALKYEHPLLAVTAFVMTLAMIKAAVEAADS
jgi:hypothetical protein